MYLEKIACNLINCHDMWMQNNFKLFTLNTLKPHACIKHEEFCFEISFVEFYGYLIEIKINISMNLWKFN